MNRTVELHRDFGKQDDDPVELSKGDDAKFSLGIVSIRYDDLPWIAKKIAIQFNGSGIFWTTRSLERQFLHI